MKHPDPSVQRTLEDEAADRAEKLEGVRLAECLSPEPRLQSLVADAWPCEEIMEDEP